MVNKRTFKVCRKIGLVMEGIGISTFILTLSIDEKGCGFESAIKFTIIGLLVSTVCVRFGYVLSDIRRIPRLIEPMLISLGSKIYSASRDCYIIHTAAKKSSDSAYESLKDVCNKMYQ